MESATIDDQGATVADKGTDKVLTIKLSSIGIAFIAPALHLSMQSLQSAFEGYS